MFYVSSVLVYTVSNFQKSTKYLTGTDTGKRPKPIRIVWFLTGSHSKHGCVLSKQVEQRLCPDESRVGGHELSASLQTQDGGGQAVGLVDGGAGLELRGHFRGQVGVDHFRGLGLKHQSRSRDMLKNTNRLSTRLHQTTPATQARFWPEDI